MVGAFPLPGQSLTGSESHWFGQGRQARQILAFQTGADAEGPGAACAAVRTERACGTDRRLQSNLEHATFRREETP